MTGKGKRAKSAEYLPNIPQEMRHVACELVGIRQHVVVFPVKIAVKSSAIESNMDFAWKLGLTIVKCLENVSNCTFILGSLHRGERHLGAVD